jgi:L-lactate dehydrogenase complex protein LldG
MSNNDSRAFILSRIRKGLDAQQLEKPFPELPEGIENQLFSQPSKDLSLDEQFAQAFIQIGGKFLYAENEAHAMQTILELYAQFDWQLVLTPESRLARTMYDLGSDILKPLVDHIETADACVTLCEAAVARTGSFIFSAQQSLGRTASIYYPVHIVLLYNNQIRSDIKDGLNEVLTKYPDNMPSMINLNTGASRTADIEKTLVVGIHGPREVYCIYINQPQPIN